MSWPESKLVDRGLQGFEMERALPRLEAHRQVVVDEKRLLVELGKIRAVAEFGDDFRGRDGIDAVVIEPHRMERAVRPFGEDDRGIDRIAELGFGSGRAVDIDVQLRVELAQFAKAREQPLAAEQRQYAEAQAQDLPGIDQTVDPVGHLVDQRRDSIVELLALLGELEQLVLALEHRLSDELLQRAQAGGTAPRGSAPVQPPPSWPSLPARRG
jgi:hypothetical protein